MTSNPELPTFMMMVYPTILAAKAQGRSLFALLIDPDRHDDASLRNAAKVATAARVDFMLVGSSILLERSVSETVRTLKTESNLPVLLFPGNNLQVTAEADALLFLSLISGRNPDLLIGQHVQAAPLIKSSGLETIPTGYLLIDSGSPTSASYMSQSAPIPHDKDDIAAATSMAGEMLGLKAIYLDAGSGAKYAVRRTMISKVRNAVSIPLFVGGGLRSPEQVADACSAGADVVVVGNSIEQDPDSLFDLVAPVRERLRN